MKRWEGVLLYAVYLVILSSLFVPLSHASWMEFGKEFLVRLVIVGAFAAVTSRVMNIGTVEAYRITELPTPAIAKEDVSPVELQDRPVVIKPQLRRGRRLFLGFWVVVLAIYGVTQTSWWSHQAWAGRLAETAIRWAILVACWGFIVVLWLPKPDANQPELLHVVPSDCPK